jgi:hypothetical protein
VREVDVVFVQVAAEGVVADPHIAPIAAGRERVRRRVRLETDRRVTAHVE